MYKRRYLRHLAAGLIESHGWTIETTATYLATRPGADLTWTPRTLTTLLTSTPPAV
ncbi:hypothetical protein [Nocardia suismassiliense]|uniref:hypothetical protein n=1 Tax=Nocardia suismassiliense TaxID=2077092 RepID=UPI001F29E635|nr:hypothetical protein [Nocardia suismassiliense]